MTSSFTCAQREAAPERSLWVDDCKPEPEGFAVARTFDDAFGLLMRFSYDALYLDHDLGDDLGRTGYDLLCDLIEADRLPPRVECISWNPVGRKRIEDRLASYRAEPPAKASVPPQQDDK